MLLAGKTVLITGASSGIGKAIAQRCIREGAHVIVWGRTKPDLDVVFSKVNVAKETEIQKAAKNLKKVDVLINNASILYLENIEGSTGKLDETIDTDLKGPYWMCKHLLPLIKKSKGNIINISSIIGVNPAPDVAAYCIAKAGVIMLTKLLAKEYAKDGIRVNAILPGPIDTPMLRSTVNSVKEMHESYGKSNPMGRIGKPEEIANAVVFLASNEASYINGVLLPVDGGELGCGF